MKTRKCPLSTWTRILTELQNSGIFFELMNHLMCWFALVFVLVLCRLQTCRRHRNPDPFPASGPVNFQLESESGMFSEALEQRTKGYAHLFQEALRYDIVWIEYLCMVEMRLCITKFDGVVRYSNKSA